MKVLCESVRPRSETGIGGQGTGSAAFGGACPAAPQTGTGAKKKGASPQQYVAELNSETVRHSRVSALLQQKLHESCGLGGEFGEPKGIEVLVEPFTVHQFSMAAGFHKAPFVEDEDAVSSLDGR